MDGITVCFGLLVVAGIVAMAVAGYWQFHPPAWWRWSAAGRGSFVV